MYFVCDDVDANAVYSYFNLGCPRAKRKSRIRGYERERLLGIAKKLMNLLAIPSSLSRSYSTFSLCSGTTLIEIAVCKWEKKEH
jgi:hypothetical protein